MSDLISFDLSKAPEAYHPALTSLMEKINTVLEGISDEPIKWSPGYLKIVQATSDRTKLPKGTGIGAMLLGDTVVEAPLKVIPLMSFTGRNYWDPDQTKNRTICRSPDSVHGVTGQKCKGCRFSVYDESQKKSPCSSVHAFLVITEDLSNIFYVQFAKTGYAAGSEWRKTMRDAAVDSYKRVYSLSTKTHPTYKNVENLEVTPAGVVPGELHATLHEIYKYFANARVEYLRDFAEAAQLKVETSGIIFDGLSYEEAVKNLIGEDNSEDNIPPSEEAAPATSTTPKKTYKM